MTSNQQKQWPTEFTADEKEMLQLGLVHALVFHQEQRKQFAKDAGDPRFKRHRAGCLRVAAHHQEEIYKLGELAAKIGMRNGWTRPGVTEMPTYGFVIENNTMTDGAQ